MRRTSLAATATATAAATFDSSATIRPSDLAVRARASTTITVVIRTQGQVAMA